MRVALRLANYERKAKEAVMAFWGNRAKARQKQIEAGKADRGERAGVTAGKNMDGFIALVMDIVKANGLKHAAIHQKRRVVTLPGYFRPTKLWDLLVLNKGQLVAAMELKSHVGPFFGNNFNNRTEEAIGTAHDLWTAQASASFRRLDDACRGRSEVSSASQGCFVALSCISGVPGSVIPQALRHTVSAPRSGAALHECLRHGIAANGGGFGGVF